MNKPPTNFRRVQADALRRFVEACLKACHLAAEYAELMAELLTRGDLRGVHSHGSQLLVGYVDYLQGGRINPTPEIRTVRDEDGLVVVDGDGGFGYLPTMRVTETVIAKARAHGLAAGTVCHIGHYGSAAHYTRVCAEAGCVGFSVQGVANGYVFPDQPIVMWGSRPISFALPSGGDWPPIIVDGCADLFREAGIGLFDQAPSAYFMSLGFTVVAKLLGDALPGEMQRQAREPSEAWSTSGTGAFVLAIDVDHFTPASGYEEAVDRFVREICSQMRPPPGQDRALLPGMLEAEREETYGREGIPLATDTCDRFEEIGEQLGVPLPW